jgi:urease accessory protein
MDGPREFPPGPAGFLAALQLADSFFPTGMYAHSHGLEGLVARGQVCTAADVAQFLENQLVWAVLPSDGVALLNAYRAADAGDLEILMGMDRLLYALKLPQELRNASTQLGQRLLSEADHLVSEGRHGMASPPPLPRGELDGGQSCATIHAQYHERVSRREAPGNGAVALGVAAAALNIPPQQTLLLFCHSHAVSVLGAALRLLPLTHTDAQVILHRLHPIIVDRTGEIEGVPWTDMTCFTPELDIASLGHESADLRMFAS